VSLGIVAQWFVKTPIEDPGRPITDVTRTRRNISSAPCIIRGPDTTDPARGASNPVNVVESFMA
jgi:hypothetical protein